MKKKWKGWLAGPLAAFVLAVSAVAVTPAIDGTAEAVDVSSKSCTLTVKPGSEEYAADLAKANVVVDVYKIADAVADSNYDTYGYNFQSIYAGLKVSAQPDNEEWNALAQQAANIALNGGTPAVSGEADKKLELLAPDLGCGLYLVIARGSNIADYVTKVKNEDGREEIATIAQSDEYTYIFAPSLVSLPSKQAEADGSISTAGAGDWLYDVTITLKPERDVRFGSLEIVKTLQNYEVKDSATFVFQVDVFLGEGEDERKVSSKVYSISFNPGSPAQKSVRIDELPVGARVTVTEVYSGAVYAVVTDATQTVVIPANDVASVAFTNDYNPTDKGGGAVTNNFTYSTSENKWGWTKIPDDAEE